MRRVFAATALFCLLPASAYAATIYVDPAGSDNNSCAAPSSPCKTITHAIDIAPSGSTVVPASGTYFENVKITKSGDGTRSVIRILPDKTSVVYIDGSRGMAGSNTVDITGNNLLLIGLHIRGGKNDGLYVHGLDSAHPATNVRVTLCGVYENANHNVEALHTLSFDMGYGRIFSSGREGVVLVDSPQYKLHDQNIYSSGMPTPAIGTLAKDSQNGEYEGNNGKENANSVNLDLENSPFTTVINNKPGTGGTFTYVVNPPSDLATDTFSNN